MTPVMVTTRVGCSRALEAIVTVPEKGPGVEVLMVIVWALTAPPAHR